jgi:hypothetical protein
MTAMMGFVVAFSVAQPPHHPEHPGHGPGPVVVVQAHPNFINPGPFIPYLYPSVPAPVVIAHPNWYRYPGPAWWYANNISPYHPVQHVVNPLPLPDGKGKEKKPKGR